MGIFLKHRSIIGLLNNVGVNDVDEAREKGWKKRGQKGGTHPRGEVPGMWDCLSGIH